MFSENLYPCIHCLIEALLHLKDLSVIYHKLVNVCAEFVNYSKIKNLIDLFPIKA